MKHKINIKIFNIMREKRDIMWLVALNYAPESSRAVRETQMGTKKEIKTERER